MHKNGTPKTPPCERKENMPKIASPPPFRWSFPKGGVMIQSVRYSPCPVAVGFVSIAIDHGVQSEKTAAAR